MVNRRTPAKASALKAQLNKAIQDNIRIDNIKWLIQPIGITMMRGDLTSTQIKIMVELIDRLQEELRNRRKGVDVDGNLQLFKESAGEEDKYRIELKTLGVPSQKYGDLDKAVKEMLAISVKLPNYNAQGNIVSISYMPLFTEITIPVSESREGTRRKGYIEMSMKRRISDEIMRIDNGYSKYIKAVAKNRSCSYTSRLYMFISTYRDYGKWIVPYVELRKMLGFTIEQYDSNEKRKVNVDLKYFDFQDFKKRVLETAKKELEAMNKNGDTDCFFDYSLLYPDGVKRGTPEKIHFHIYKSALIKQIEAENMNVKTDMQLESLLHEVLGLPESTCRRLAGKVTDANRDGFMKKVDDLKAHIHDAGKRVKDKAAYSARSLEQFLDESVEQVNSTPGHGAIPDESPVADCTKSNPANILSEEERGKWGEVMKRMQEKNESAFNTWLADGQMQLCAVSDGLLQVKVPSKTYIESLERISGIKLSDIEKMVEVEWGSGFRLNYTAR